MLEKNKSYAIIQTSGKQFLIMPNAWYDFDFFKEGKPGDGILFEKVLFLSKNNEIQIGYPFLSNTKIFGKILQTVRGKKLQILKTRPKKNYTKTKGYYSKYTRVKFVIK